MIPIRFFWLGVFAVLVGIASFLAEEVFFPFRAFPSGTLEAQIHEDFKKLQDQSLLPHEIKSLHEVYILDDRIQRAPINWTQLSQYDFSKDPNGRFDLQIELFDAQENTKKAQKNDFVVIQYSLFDKASKNKIWELSRQYFYP
jgi:hypothetical protein